MKTAEWIFEDGRVRLLSGHEIIEAPADIVWSSEFEGLSTFAGFKFLEPSSNIEHIEFSEVPFIPAFQIRKTSAGGRVLWVTHEHTPNSDAFINDVTSDQIIIDNNWFYNIPADFEPALDELTSRKIYFGIELNEAQYLWLIWQSRLKVVDVDCIAEYLGDDIEGDEVETERPLLAIPLYPYQLSGFEKIRTLYRQNLGCLLADEMGLGKTAQAIAHLTCREEAAAPDLIVAPSSLLTNWAREITNFAPQLKTHVHSGARRAGAVHELTKFDTIITSYDVLIKDRYLFMSKVWNYLILDEAQYIKNPKSARSKVCKSLVSRHRVAITGTPIENSLTDAWSLAEFIVPEYLPDYEEFAASYPDEQWAAARLGSLLAPLTLRRHVTDVLKDLPEKIETRIPVEVSSGFTEEYLEILNSAAAPFEAYTSLSKLCSKFTEAKAELLHDIIEGAFSRDEKVIVFTPFTDSNDAIKASLTCRYPDAFVSTIDGRVDVGVRQNIIDEYTCHSGNAVLIMNPRAAGVGLNIQASNVVIHFSPVWNPATIDQATARAYRNGQEKPVFVYMFYYKETVEEIMMNRLDLKRGLSREGMSAASLEPTTSELSDLFITKPRITT